MANKAKLHSFRSKPIYMCDFQVPRNHAEALELDGVNGNTMWTDAEMTELNQIDEYKSFIDKGVGYNPGSNHKGIRAHMVHAVKHDGRHKARLVAGGHVTETPVDSACSSVVSLSGARLLAFIGELNGLKIWSTDIGNAYLETCTKEKVHVIAGPEFGDREGHVLIVSKALWDYTQVGYVGQNVLRMSSERWDFSHPSVRKTFGCVTKEISTNTLQCVLTI